MTSFWLMFSGWTGVIIEINWTSFDGSQDGEYD